MGLQAQHLLKALDVSCYSAGTFNNSHAFLKTCHTISVFASHMICLLKSRTGDLIKYHCGSTAPRVSKYLARLSHASLGSLVRISFGPAVFALPIPASVSLT